jgi:hypothetical protein
MGAFEFVLPDAAGLTSEARAALAEQLPYLDPSIVRAGWESDVLTVSCGPGHPDEAALRDKVVKLYEQVAASFARVQVSTVFELEGRELRPDGDPHERLRDAGELVSVGPGMFAYSGRLLETVNRCDELFLGIARRCSARELAAPALLSMEVARRTGYLRGFPHQAILASTASPGHAADRFERPSEGVGLSPFGLLSPTVCYNGFASLGALTALPVVWTGVNQCHRNEHHNVHGLERLSVFRMREIVFVAEQAEHHRARLLDETRRLVEWLGLRCRVVTATDPFFAGTLDRKRAFQSALQLKYELQAYLPYGDRWLSCASFNHHLGTMVEAFELGAPGAASLESGCVGYGLERFALALYAQFGSAPSRWPFRLESARHDPG